jgi:hypothetical protein
MNGLKAAPITADEVRSALPDATSHIDRDRCGEHNIIRRAVDIAAPPASGASGARREDVAHAAIVRAVADLDRDRIELDRTLRAAWKLLDAAQTHAADARRAACDKLAVGDTTDGTLQRAIRADAAHKQLERAARLVAEVASDPEWRTDSDVAAMIVEALIGCV